MRIISTKNEVAKALATNDEIVAAWFMEICKDLLPSGSRRRYLRKKILCWKGSVATEDECTQWTTSWRICIYSVHWMHRTTVQWRCFPGGHLFSVKYRWLHGPYCWALPRIKSLERDAGLCQNHRRAFRKMEMWCIPNEALNRPDLEYTCLTQDLVFSGYSEGLVRSQLTKKIYENNVKKKFLCQLQQYWDPLVPRPRYSYCERKYERYVRFYYGNRWFVVDNCVHFIAKDEHFDKSTSSPDEQG